MDSSSQKPTYSAEVIIHFGDFFDSMIAAKMGIKAGVIIGILLAVWKLFNVQSNTAFPLPTMYIVKTLAIFSFGFAIFTFLTQLFCWLFFFFRLSKDQKQVLWTINEDAVTLTDAAGTSVVTPWGGIRSFKGKKKGLLFIMLPSGPRWIPKRTFDEALTEKILKLANKKLS